MSKHTPGPWRAERSHLHDGYRIEATDGQGDNMTIGEVWPTYPWSSGGSANPEGNAGLIASAPDLLGACQCLVKCLIDLAPYPPEVAEGVLAIVAMCQETIKKAGAK